MADRTVEESIETVIEMTVMTEAGSGPEKGHFFRNMATMQETEVQAVVGPGQDQEQVQTRIEFDVISVGNMIILQGTVPLLGKKRKLNSSKKCSIWGISKLH